MYITVVLSQRLQLDSQGEATTSVEKSSVAKTALLVWTLNAINMTPLLKNSGSVGPHVNSIVRVDDVPRRQRHHYNHSPSDVYYTLHATNVSCSQFFFLTNHYIFWSDQRYHLVHIIVDFHPRGNLDELLLNLSVTS